jgi:hypothetical protein
MFKFLKKNFVLTIILAAILLISSILMIVPMGDAKSAQEAWIIFNADKNISLNFIELIGGILLLFLGIYILIPQIKKNVSVVKFMYLFELILFFFVAISGFLVPAICHLAGHPWHMFAKDGYTEGELINSISFWIGLLLFVHGFIVLYACSYTKQDKPFWYFIVGIVLLSVGVFLMVSGLGINIGQILNYIIIYSFLLVGLILLIIGLVSIKKKEQVVSPAKESSSQDTLKIDAPKDKATTKKDPEEKEEKEEASEEE